jgi:hypothetical protein
MSRSALSLLFALTSFGCDGGDPTEPLVLDDDPVDSTPVVTTPPEPSCGPIELCTRSTQECGYEVTVETCASWYDEPANCADMDAYVECNCDCLGQDTCDQYYACGELCFADHC